MFGLRTEFSTAHRPKGLRADMRGIEVQHSGQPAHANARSQAHGTNGHLLVARMNLERLAKSARCCRACSKQALPEICEPAWQPGTFVSGCFEILRTIAIATRSFRMRCVRCQYQYPASTGSAEPKATCSGRQLSHLATKPRLSLFADLSRIF